MDIINDGLLDLIKSDNVEDNRLALKILHQKCPKSRGYVKLRDELVELWETSVIDWVHITAFCKWGYDRNDKRHLIYRKEGDSCIHPIAIIELREEL